MANNRSRSGILIGLGAAVGAFGAAAMMSAAAAPIARADDLTDIINAVDGDFALGQTAFTTATSDFGSNELAPGLAALFNGVDDDALSAPNNLLAGSVEALTNETITPADGWGLMAPSSFSDALTNAESFIGDSGGIFASSASDLVSGDYGGAAFYGLDAAYYASIIPLEELLLGAAVSF